MSADEVSANNHTIWSTHGIWKGDTADTTSGTTLVTAQTVSNSPLSISTTLGKFRTY